MDAQKSPVTLGNITMKEKFTDKYLGDILNSSGLSASVESTVKGREAKTRGVIGDISLPPVTITAPDKWRPSLSYVGYYRRICAHCCRICI